MSIKNKILSVVFSSAVLTAMFSVISSAEGASASGSKGAGIKGILPMIIYVVLLLALMYFLFIRPQKKRQKQEQELRDSLILGDEITTIGGVVGKVVNIKDDNITIETSIDKTLIEFKNWAIREVKKLETEAKVIEEKK